MYKILQTVEGIDYLRNFAITKQRKDETELYLQDIF